MPRLPRYCTQKPRKPYQGEDGGEHTEESEAFRFSLLRLGRGYFFKGVYLLKPSPVAG